ncbi:DUF3237 domain-containing protein [Microbacterium horticulturae]|uniref:UPF0311 protein PU630_00410 n=1 Tax=Microbacterium horticulturae TaxID=3028316 RepID=A0ABY8C1D3_9MICO|nr:DUF3237 domain-containing protein [Microbacterium sp. KACC 23027]WEG09060.1 DUF3237 domain-containing protein [Microbacterium sp. KACC 23027]
MTDILDHVAAPALRPVSSIRVDVDEPVDLGEGSDGRRRIVPILGGTATGELSGRVLGGGADFQVLRPDRVTELEARYPIALDDGTLIEVVNRGIRAAAPDDIDRLMRGEIVDPDRVYFRCTPTLRAPRGQWEWLNRTLFVGTGRRHPDSVEISVFAVG